MSWLDSIIKGLIPDTLGDIYSTPLPTIDVPDITFKPFTVSGPSGTINTDPSGGTSYSLDPTQQAMASKFFGGAGAFADRAMVDTGQRETDIYNRIRAAQSPEEQRAAQLLEERMAAQGRLGVSTAQYGGTPEQLAMAKAQAEAQNTAMLSAMQQAQAEQAQQASLAGQFLQQSYAPQAALLSSFNPALNVASMADVGRRQQGEFDIEAQIAALQGALGQQQGQASLYGGVYSGLLGGLGSILTSGNSETGRPWWLDIF
jgi:hypothetical protein